ncbi:putative A/G-specific adenine glycosylase YfhQ [Staphylococcus arlettae]|uniref:A/G-specific adenine glycosylase n=2 Tax=Staphylococcus arlettae TaxID=29378 RepID=UPI00190A54BD|nr:A/G-specific adenine glycosylase [Staphylococcus arlettae]MBK3720497.1 putative A/G-specific adenine glycosylase YfhQ [Staphylococcus arlettae]
MYNEKRFKNNLLQWFDTEQRAMPWRETKNPYYIWLSEVMLQQTQVKTVIDYYLRFIARFPTIRDLSEAHEDEVLKLWEGLGYYSRARNFHTAIQDVHQNHHSEVPTDPKTFGELKGVGPYTQAAVMSIAFNQPLPTVDGNVFRVWSRLNNDTRDTKLQTTRKAYEAELAPYVQQSAGDFNQAMMELGAMICTPKAPLCLFCPVQEHCEAFEQGTVADLPVKTTKVKKKVIKQHVYLVKNEFNEYLITKRKANLLNNMWQFPMYDIEDEHSLESDIGVNINFYKQSSYQLKHQFTHLTWDIKAFEATDIVRKQDITLTEDMVWLDLKQKDNYNFPVSMTKIYQFLTE